uniref:Uncharacterized protein n=1 Tax=Siphoviridae sp. ctR0j7 TaxID=2823580 RepID=A0A8S5LHN7_9CAUD|nr:MAG TPA: hypothetical protein [Siphoviridae sp. ctR0j7]
MLSLQSTRAIFPPNHQGVGRGGLLRLASIPQSARSV